MAYYMYCPLDLTVKQQHIYTLLFSRSEFKDNYRVACTIEQLTMRSDNCFGLTDKMVRTIVKQLIDKKYLKEVSKGKKGVPTVYEICVNYITSGNESVTNRSSIGNESVSNDEPLSTLSCFEGNELVTNRSSIGNEKVNLIIKKEEKKEKNKKTFLSDSIEYRLADYVYKHILKFNENFKQPNIQEWSNHIDLMIRIDKRNADEIKQVIDWVYKDEFWYKNILSTSKLRKQYDQLIIKMNSNKSNTTKQHSDGTTKSKVVITEEYYNPFNGGDK